MANTYAEKTIIWGHGQNSLYAGTPLDTNGKIANDSTAIGIVAEDLHAPDTVAKVLTAGEWDEDAHPGCGIKLRNATKAALSNITFAHPPVDYIDSGELTEILSAYATSTDLEDYAKTADLADYAKTADLADYVQKTDVASTDAAGIVYQGAAVADAESAPTQAEYNGLLGSLRTAGIIATPAETPEEET